MATAKLLDQFGNVLPSTKQRMRAMLGGEGRAYDGASWVSQETRDWFARLESPDREVGRDRKTLVARSRDLARNDPWASGALVHILDASIGIDLRLMAQPDWRLLKRFNKAFDEVWSREFRREAEASWRLWAGDPGLWCDAERRFPVGEQFRIALRQHLVTGEAIVLLPWIPERRGAGGAHYSTAIQLVDSDRLSNPNEQADTLTMRQGVELDGRGAPVAYHFREGHEGDTYPLSGAFTWKRVERELQFGRPQVLHFFEAERPDQHRPAGGIFTPILSQARMLSKYGLDELKAADLAATMPAYLESPNDPNMLQDALDDSGLETYQTLRKAFHEDRSLSLANVRIPTLFPGEKLITVQPNRPGSNFGPFVSSSLRAFAAATGQSYEQVSHDWSQSNYSSARGALLQAYLTLDRRREQFARGIATQIYGALLEESMDRGELPLPSGAPDFMDARGPYMTASWMGPARGWIDPVKEAEAAQLRRQAFVSTLRDECAEQGKDYEEVVAQLADENALFEEYGLEMAPAAPRPGAPAEKEAADSEN